MLIIREITDRKRVLEQVLNQQKELAAAEERERMARELHDSMAQVLGYLNFQIRTVSRQIELGEADSARSGLERMGSIAREAHDNVREYIRQVRNGGLQGEKFEAALEICLERFKRDYGIETALETGAGVETEPQAAAQLLRIVQEALTNARKHAGATSVRVTLTGGPGLVRLTVEDNGRGFNPSATCGEGKYGLEIMRERARELGGSVEVDSAPGRGTRVSVLAPLTDRRDTKGFPPIWYYLQESCILHPA